MSAQMYSVWLSGPQSEPDSSPDDLGAQASVLADSADEAAGSVVAWLRILILDSRFRGWRVMARPAIEDDSGDSVTVTI